jgi:hypothetical protein
MRSSVDLTMRDDKDKSRANSDVSPTPLIEVTDGEGGDEEVALVTRRLSQEGAEPGSSAPSDSTAGSLGLNLFAKRDPLGKAGGREGGEQIDALVKAFQESEMEVDGDESVANGDFGEERDVETESRALRGYKRANWWTQFTILSGRAFKNLYRNPMLLLTHYAVSIVLARELSGCLFLWRKVLMDVIFYFYSHLCVFVSQSQRRHLWFPESDGIVLLRPRPIWLFVPHLARSI